MNEPRCQPAASEDCSNPPVLGHQGVVTAVSNGFVRFTGSPNSVIGFPIIPVKVKAGGHLGYVPFWTVALTPLKHRRTPQTIELGG